jgi:hypothetical protein
MNHMLIVETGGRIFGSKPVSNVPPMKATPIIWARHRVG